MPWQRTAADLLEAIDPETGLRRFPFVVITVPRQAGKSTLLLTSAIRRCLLEQVRPTGSRQREGHRFWYTAQSGAAAAEKFAELARALVHADSPFAGRIAIRWTNGSQAATFPNGSTLRPFPPTRDSLHGKQADTVVIDEGFSFDQARGSELLQACGPAMATRPGAQAVVISTQGDAQSVWLSGLIDRGRDGAPGIAFLEYGIGDEIPSDPADLLDAVIAAHPAVGVTITPAYLRHQQHIMEPLEFARAYGNARTVALSRLIDPRTWQAAATTAALPAGPITLAADLALDRSRAAIVAARLGIVEVIDSREGTQWVAPRIRDLVQRWHPAAVAVLRTGPSATLADDLDRAGVILSPITDATYATACARFLDDITNQTVSYRIHPALDAAVAASASRRLGEGWAWSRRAAAAPICELVAATLASWLDQHRPAPAPAPSVFAG